LLRVPDRFLQRIQALLDVAKAGLQEVDLTHDLIELRAGLVLSPRLFA
jgi:hypothetical protein